MLLQLNKFVLVQFQAYFNAFLRLSLLGLGAYCVYITGKELFPGRMNPNSLFSEVFEKLRYHEEVSPPTFGFLVMPFFT